MLLKEDERNRPRPPGGDICAEEPIDALPPGLKRVHQRHEGARSRGLANSEQEFLPLAHSTIECKFVHVNDA